MKVIFYLAFLLVTVMSCNRELTPSNQVLTKQFTIKDLVESKLNLYEINENVTPLLDSIIININECIRYKNIQVGYVFTIEKDTTDKTIFTIENTSDFYQFDYSRCEGVFYYKGYQFLIIGIVCDSLLKDLGQFVQLFGINKEKLQTMYKGNDEFFHSSWSYIYDGEDFRCVDFNACDKFWSIYN